MALNLLRQLGGESPVGGQGVNAKAARFDQREFGGNEKTVGQKQKHNGDNGRQRSIHGRSP